MASHTQLQQLRHSAFIAQQGRCYYCALPMWESDLEAFAQEHRLTPTQAAQFKCTAEHLQARQDGGKDSQDNIVAACLCCNQRRHQGQKNAPTPEKHKRSVQKQVRNGGWHKRKAVAALQAIM